MHNRMWITLVAGLSLLWSAVVFAQDNQDTRVAVAEHYALSIELRDAAEHAQLLYAVAEGATVHRNLAIQYTGEIQEDIAGAKMHLASIQGSMSPTETFDVQKSLGAISQYLEQADQSMHKVWNELMQAGSNAKQVKQQAANVYHAMRKAEADEHQEMKQQLGVQEPPKPYGEDSGKAIRVR